MNGKFNVRQTVTVLFITMVVSFAIVGFFLASPASGMKNQEIDVKKSVSGEIRNIQIAVVSEDVHIIPTDGSEVTVHFYGRVKGIGSVVPDLVVEESNGTLIARVDHGGAARIGINLQFDGDLTLDIYVPSNYADVVSVRTVSGSAEVGTFSVNRFTFDSVSGDLTTDGLFAEDTRIKTISGDVELEGFQGRLSAQSTSGNLHARCRAIVDDMKLNTISGNIDISLPQNSVFGLSTHTLSGNIRNEFGYVDSWQSQIVADTTSGNVTIRKR